MTLLEFTQRVIEGRIQVTAPPIPVYDSEPCPLGENGCQARHPDNWVCTLRKDHRGPHIAHASGNYICATWAQ